MRIDLHLEKYVVSSVLLSESSLCLWKSLNYSFLSSYLFTTYYYFLSSFLFSIFYYFYLGSSLFYPSFFYSALSLFLLSSSAFGSILGGGGGGMTAFESTFLGYS